MSDFTPLALSRARYYYKGSPVQFVCVELLRMEQTGAAVVTLSFKNVYSQPLTGLTVRFQCKTREGTVLADEEFDYENISVPEGGVFGNDDAVFVSDQALGGVDVQLVSATFGAGRTVSLAQCGTVPLAALQKLPPERAARLQHLLGVADAQFMPANAADGWQCACGAFNYNAGRSKTQCSECGTVKANLIQALKAAAQPQGGDTLGFNVPAAPPAAPQAETRTIAFSAKTVDTTQVLPAISREQTVAASAARQIAQTDAEATRVIPAQSAPELHKEPLRLMQDTTADFILRWVPVITAGVSAVYVGCAFLVQSLIR